MTGSGSLLAMADPAAAVSRALDGMPIHLLTLDALAGRHRRDVLRHVLTDDAPCRMVVDARESDEISPARLAALLRLRRRARARGGNVVLIVGEQLRGQLGRTGMLSPLRCVATPEQAIAALTPAPAPALPVLPAPPADDRLRPAAVRPG